MPVLLYSLVCVVPGRNPNCWVSHAKANEVRAIFLRKGGPFSDLISDWFLI